MKKLLSVFLALSMLLSCIGIMASSVAKKEETELFFTDFSSDAEGKKPSGMTVQENEATKVFARCALDGDNSYLRIYHEPNCDCGKSGSPTARYTIDISKYETMTVRLKAKNDGIKAVVQFYSAEPKATTKLATVSDTKWTDVEIHLDFIKMTYATKINGQDDKQGELHSVDTKDTCQIRLIGSTPNPGEAACFDDLKITAVLAEGVKEDSADDEELPSEAAFTPTTQANVTQVPADAYIVFNTDFNNATIKTAAKTKLQTPDGEIAPFYAATSYTEIQDVNKNRMLVLGTLDGKGHNPRVQIALPSSAKHYSFDYAVAHSGGSSLVEIYADGAKKNEKTIARIKDTDDAWHYVHLYIDLEKNTVSGTVDGAAFEEITLADITDYETVRLRLNAGLSANEIVYVDAMSLYTQDEFKATGMLMGNNKVAWEHVKPSKPIDENSFVSNLTAHPRVFVHNWDYMREHVNDDYMTRSWYAGLKKAADTALNTNPTIYKLNDRGNILDAARSARTRLTALAFTYKIEGDKKYLDKAYEEMLIYGEWPEWSAYTAMLATAEILQGYAYAYDWLYEDLTKEQRSKIMDILKKHALPVYIYQYEQQTGSVVSTGNWNPDINATAIALALAIAEDEPNIAEYILEKAPPCIMEYYTPAYAPQGGYHEGVSYWDLGTSFMLFATDFLENAFVEGFELPENYIFWKAPGVAETPDFGIYYDGPVEKFNYGDCTSGHTNCVVMYWVANRFNKPHYAWWQSKRQTEDGAFLSSFDAIAALAWYDADNAYLTPGAFPLDKFYTAEGGVNGASMRSSWEDSTALWAGLQGGNNFETHQHNSVGTYAIDYMGQRFIRVLGEHAYALTGPKYYSRSEAYNNLIINPTAEYDQLESSNSLIKNGTSEGTAFGILDLTNTHNDYVSAKRGLMLTDNRNRIIVQDEVVAKKPSEFYWFAISDANIQIAPDGKSALLTMNGERMLARIIEAPAEARFSLMDRRSLFSGIDNYIGNSAGQKLYMHFTDKTELNICVEYVPLRDGEGIPDPWKYTSLDNWSADDHTPTLSTLVGADVLLKLGTPNAIANGVKTFVDTNNTEVVPFTENGRTLVPVRFISESFGAKVGWDEATQTVTISLMDKEIKLVIGSNEMYVNGETVILDVPANTYNSRTLIPLRALVEALGKSVFWDNRGLISIGDVMPSYTEEQLTTLIRTLDLRVSANGKDLVFFLPERTDYAIDVNAGATVPQIAVSTLGAENVSVVQATAIGETAIVTIDGVEYRIKIQQNTFENITGNLDAGVISKLDVMSAGVNLPDHDTFIYVESLTDSTEFASYPERGIVDGVINENTINRWAANGDGHWIQMDFGSVKNVHSMSFAGVTQTERAYRFDVLVSTDGENYTTVHTGGAPTTTDKMSIIPLGDVKARYVKLLCHGNSVNTWNTYAEVRFYENAAQQAEDVSYWPSYFAEKEISGAAGTSVKVLLTAKDSKKSAVQLRADANVTYTIDNPKIATVSPDGMVTFVKKGTTELTITVKQDGFSATTSVPVTAE